VLLKSSWAGFQRFSFSSALPEFKGDRLTRVPFLKFLVRGSFEVILPTGGKLIHPGTGLLFAPQSFVPIRFPMECEFLRITFEHDGLLIGREAVTPHLRHAPENVPAGELKALWLKGATGQPAAGLLDRLLHMPDPVELQMSALAQSLCWEILTRLDTTQPALSTPENPVDRMLRYLKDQCHHSINRTSAAKALGVSPGYLGTLIKRRTGKPFQNVLMEMRLENAKWMLSQSQLDVEEVALRSGFSSANYFTQLFRKAEGISPREWRRRNQ